MSLLPSAVQTDTQVVWDYVDGTEEQRSQFEPNMEGWINGATMLLERLCKRHIRAREYVELWQNGSGRDTLMLPHYPLLRLDYCAVDRSGTIEEIDIAENIRVHKDTGKLTLRKGGDWAIFPRGTDNIILTYKAGFDGLELAPFQDALNELILVVWRARQGDPLMQQRNDSMGSSAFFTRFDPKKLPFIVQQVVDQFTSYA